MVNWGVLGNVTFRNSLFIMKNRLMEKHQSIKWGYNLDEILLLVVLSLSGH